MASSITAFRFRKIRRQVPGRDRREEAMILECPGGSIILPRSVLEETGDSWDRVRERAKRAAQDKNIPFLDEMAEQ